MPVLLFSMFMEALEEVAYSDKTEQLTLTPDVLSCVLSSPLMEGGKPPLKQL